MTQFAQMAQKHWQEHLPNRYAALPNPSEFFLQLGQEAESRFSSLWRGMAGPDRPGETYLEKVGRLNMARLRAQEQVLTEIVLIEPETTEPE